MSTVAELRNKTKVELVPLAKSLGVKSPYSLNKELLTSEVEKKMTETKSEVEKEVILCVHGEDISKCKTYVEKRSCVHGRYKYSCRPCGGSRYCKHGKLFCNCKECYEKRERYKQSLRLKPVR